ncbi:hypothetical protein FOMPIDRAFT_8452, partial [Fomitopsis schrenkii]
PTLFSMPFVTIIVGTSYMMQTCTQTPYDLHGKKTDVLRPTQVDKEQELGLAASRKKFDIQEEYF